MPVDVLPALAARRPVDGPATFDVTTAAALLAAAMGIRVVKTSSHGSTRRSGSLGTLERPTDPGLYAVAARIADSRPHRALWLTRNGLGTGDLLSFAANAVRPGPNRSETTIAPGFASGGHPHTGTLADLRPAGPGEPAETHLRALLRGEGPAAARETVCLNAAVAALAAGADQSLAETFHAAEDAVRDGAAVRLVAGRAALDSAMAEYGLDEELRSAPAVTFHSGTAETQYHHIAATLGLGRAA
ncbi:hypothetical protein [Streptomyces sp. B22F1]|uniref:hypothetical protein n=1 Tax=Streptomyces sp. B22F1 TaxID=3153566 RepID=UPI00325E5F6A